MRFCDLAFFASCGGFGNGSGFGAASGFDALCCCSACCFFCFAQSTPHGGVGVFCLMCEGGLGCVTSSRVCCDGSGFSFGLSEQCLLTDLLGGTMSQLSAVLPTRCRKVAVLCSMKICPGVEDRHIFGGLRHCLVIVPVRAARIHKSASCVFHLRFELRRFAASSNAEFAPVVMQ